MVVVPADLSDCVVAREVKLLHVVGLEAGARADALLSKVRRWILQ